MYKEHTKRELSAMLSATVKGYISLMGEEEFTTIETPKKYRLLICSSFEQFRGRVVDSSGDNLLIERQHSGCCRRERIHL